MLPWERAVEQHPARAGHCSTEHMQGGHRPRASQQISKGQSVRDCLGTQLLAQHQNTSRLETALSQSDIHYPAASTSLLLPCATIYPVWK